MMTDASRGTGLRRASVGTIARSVGNPNAVPQWRPRCARFSSAGQFGLHRPCSHGSIAVG